MTPVSPDNERAQAEAPLAMRGGETNATSKAVPGRSSGASGGAASLEPQNEAAGELVVIAAAPATAPPSNDYSGVLGFLIVASIFYKLWVWDNLATRAWQIGVTSAVVLLLLVTFVILWKRSKGQDAFHRFLDKVGLLGTLWFTILGAAAVAVMLDSDSRALSFKLFAIGFFSALPSWLYYQFLARRGSALWDEYVVNLFRLHADRFAALPMPPRHSVFYRPWLQGRAALGADGAGEPDTKNVYRKKFEGVFGPVTDQPEQNFFRGENAVPVIMATVLISVGWVIVIQPESVLGYPLFPAFEWTGSPAVPIAELRFAFLGAYFFILQMLVRRYYQNDLKTGAYINATLRIVIVVLITWILGAIWTGAETAGWRLAVAFTIGVFPDVGWQLLQRTVKLRTRRFEVFNQRYPLSDLDGLNLWYESRLVEEGVEDLQTLVTANIVDVMLYTRIPVERLVDWIDQAVLYLHVAPDSERTADSARARLRRYGIRAATDILDAYDAKAGKFAVPGMENLLNTAEDTGPNVMLAVCTALQREPVLHYVRRWKYFPDEYLAPEVIPASLAKYGMFTPTHGVTMEAEGGTS